MSYDLHKRDDVVHVVFEGIKGVYYADYLSAVLSDEPQSLPFLAAPVMDAFEDSKSPQSQTESVCARIYVLACYSGLFG